MSDDLFDKIRDRLQKIFLEKYYESSLNNQIIHPKNNIPPLLLMFYTYVQPAIMVFSTTLMIVMSFLLWERQFWKKYGLMTVYTTLELCSFLVYSAAIFGFTIEDKNYIEYEYCTLYRISTSVVPTVLYCTGHWLKVAHALQWVLAVNVPLTFKKYFTVKYIGIAISIIAFIFITLLTWSLFYFETKETYTLDQKSKQVMKVCRYKSDAIKQDGKATDAISIAVYVLGDIIPVLGLVMCSCSLIRKIWKQEQFRQQFQTSDGKNNDTKRIIVVVIINTIMFVIAALPKFFTVVYANLEANPETKAEIEIIIVIERAYRCITVPITCILFAYLSANFRNGFRKMISCGSLRLPEVKTESDNGSIDAI